MAMDNEQETIRSKRIFQTNAPCPGGAPPALKLRQAGSNHENILSMSVKVTVTKPVSFRGKGLREFLKPKDVTE